MGSKFHGDLKDLQGKLAPLNLMGEWRSLPNVVHKFVCKDKAGLNWSETKGTVWYDGPDPARRRLETLVESALVDAVPAQAATGSTIFVVHGRDTSARDQLELILRRLGLAPFVL